MRFAFFAPVVVGEVAYAAVFRLMFNLDFGIINKLLGRRRPRRRSQWFANPTAAMALIIMAVTWRWVGYNAIIILSGLQSIPEDVYEAATLDRVSPVRQFFYITLPLLRPIILFCVVLSVIGTMQLFAEPFLITNRGGPGGATETLGLFLYRQGFTVLNFGYASAVAYTIAALAVVDLADQPLAREGPRMRSQSPAGSPARFALHAVLVPLALVWLFPLWMMVVFSTMPDNGIFSPAIELVPSDQLPGELRACSRPTPTSCARCSVSVVVGARLHRPLGDADLDGRLGAGALPLPRQAAVVVGIILGTLTLPYFVVVIPQFIMVARDFKLANTWFALIVPPLFNSLGVLFMRQSFSMMPADLFDAARVEGVKRVADLPPRRACRWRGRRWPRCRSSCSCTRWNNYLWPLLISSNPRMMTAPVALGTLIGAHPGLLGRHHGRRRSADRADARGLRLPAALLHRRHRRRRGEVTGGDGRRHPQIVVKRYGTFEVDPRRHPRGRGRRVRRLRRAVRLRQVDAAAHDRRARGHLAAARSASAAGSSTTSSPPIAASPWCSSPTRSIRT